MNAWFASFLPAVLHKKLEGRVNLQKILANIGWLFVDRMLRMGVGLLVGIWVARYLGVDQFGIYNYAMAFVALFSVVAMLGLDTIVIRELVRVPEARNEIMGTAFVLKLLAGILVSVAALITIRTLQPEDPLTQWLVLVLLIGVILQAFDTIDFWFQAEVNSKYTVYSKNFAFLVSAAIKIYFIQIRAPLAIFVLAGLVDDIIGAIGLVISYRINKHAISAWRFRLTQAKTLMRDSWPLILSSVMIMIYMRIDQIMLGQMIGNSEVGVYSAAVKFAEVWYFIPMIVVSSVYPSVIASRKVSETLFYERLQRLYNLMALLGYAVAIPMTVLSGPLIHFLLGPGYERAGPMLAILVWGGIFTNLGVARSTFLTTMNWTRVHFFTVSLGCVVNIILNLLLIPRYGGIGAAIASCVAYWTASHGACFFYRPLFRTGIMLTKALIYPKAWG